ncbi:hypothetical protein EX30DRAFT_120971 [Ascodesmis nigricans]|uniref:Rhodopsin domain-containing protein n=1 Tax=Ascodesmis nigricans TaxID=341454 RepID=A0A4S2MPC3_9PEZI|nr:hypothetical protein EX30DRAFT_120971 [Ascodesmis nigricans]
MNPQGLIAFQVVGGVLLASVCYCRVLVAYRRHWLPYNSERFGVATFVIACCLAWVVMGIRAADGVKIIIWRKSGATDLLIRLKLLTVKDFQALYATNLVSVTTVYVGKASFLSIYSASYNQFTRRIRWLYNFSVAYTIVTYLIVISLFSLYCWPIDRNWLIGQGFCATILHPVPFNVGIALSMSSDILLFSLPLILIISLGVRSRNEKVGVALIVFLGVVSVAVGMYRVLDTHVNQYTRGRPLTLESRNSYMVSEAVMNTLLLTAFSLPSIRVLFRHSSAQQRRSTDRRKGAIQRSRSDTGGGIGGSRSFSGAFTSSGGTESKRLYGLELQPV